MTKEGFGSPTSVSTAHSTISPISYFDESTSEDGNSSDQDRSTHEEEKQISIKRTIRWEDFQRP